MCGEKDTAPVSPIGVSGSPPRVRGKVDQKSTLLAKKGITPACAGKSLCNVCVASRKRDHPRVCGEKLCCHCKITPLLGSPPRVRGKAYWAKTGAYNARITPACAGKRHSLRLRSPAWRDHPRVCGEKDTWSFSSSPRTGSPPRVRGKVITYQLTPERSGITPACAGKRNSQHTTFTSERDHPRVCGEKGGPHRAGHPPRGSPPRVRGKAEWENLIGSDVRITPACAGKRKSHSKHKKHHRDHPRVCGEKTMKEVREVWQLGSPPRVRGKDLLRKELLL